MSVLPSLLDLFPFTPKVHDVKDNFYSYEWINGSVMSKSLDSSAFIAFLDWIKELWVEHKLTKEQKDGLVSSMDTLLQICTEMIELKDTARKARSWFNWILKFACGRGDQGSP